MHYELIELTESIKEDIELEDKQIFITTKKLVHQIQQSNILKNRSLFLKSTLELLQYIQNYMNANNNEENISRKTFTNFFEKNNVCKVKKFLEHARVLQQIPNSNGKSYDKNAHITKRYNILNEYIFNDDLYLVIFRKESYNKTFSCKIELDNRYKNTIKNIDINLRNAYQEEYNWYLKTNKLSEFKHRLNRLFKFVNEDRYIKKGDNVNRIYHNLSNLSKESSKHLTYQFYDLDVTNMQPMLLLYLLKKNNLEFDQQYYDDCVDGCLYEIFMFKSYKITHKEDGKYFTINKYLDDRDETKVATYSHIFFKFKKGYDLNNEFKKLYPITWESYKTYIEKEERESAAILQDLEAEIILDIVPPKSSHWYNKHDQICFSDLDDYSFVLNAIVGKFKNIGIELKNIKFNGNKIKL